MIDFSVKQTVTELLKPREGCRDLVRLLKLLYKEIPYESGSLRRKMWCEQIGLNLPMIVLASVDLHRVYVKNKCRVILFATRDCTHWYKVFSAMYPDVKCHYFCCSRNMFNSAREKANPHFQRYVRDLTCGGDTGNTLFVDIHGTGERMVKYFKERWDEVPHCYLLTAGPSRPKKLPEDSYEHYKQGRLTSLHMNVSGSPIEMLNYDTVGSVNDYDSDGPVRADIEYEQKRVQPYHDCVAAFLGIFEREQKLRAAAGKSLHFDVSSEDVSEIVAEILDKLRERENKPTIARWTEHQRRHERNPEHDDLVHGGKKSKKTKKSKKRRDS